MNLNIPFRLWVYMVVIYILITLGYYIKRKLDKNNNKPYCKSDIMRLISILLLIVILIIQYRPIYVMSKDYKPQTTYILYYDNTTRITELDIDNEEEMKPLLLLLQDIEVVRTVQSINSSAALDVNGSVRKNYAVISTLGTSDGELVGFFYKITLDDINVININNTMHKNHKDVTKESKEIIELIDNLSEESRDKED